MIVLEQCFEICTLDIEFLRSRAARIADSPFINPQRDEGISISIDALALEVLMTMISNQLIVNDRIDWELYRAMPCALLLKRKGVSI